MEQKLLSKRSKNKMRLPWDLASAIGNSLFIHYGENQAGNQQDLTGISITNFVPCPSVESHQILPPCFWVTI